MEVSRDEDRITAENWEEAEWILKHSDRYDKTCYIYGELVSEEVVSDNELADMAIDIYEMTKD